MVTTTYQVRGMTCGHCVNAVSAEVGGLTGVEKVQVDLEAGRLTVTSQHPMEIEAVRAAVDEAGYDLVDAAPTSRPRPA
ncbi:heavy-metal-associated domain-containing protein [Salinispora tropica]|uniref:Heavy metal transport/detoxification protein n=1 Tax=Salinispora tropica (strain ATCC BAA-916 / DSM 44818 / JCM 13857 / NBRC 105044 / CNB-440) TaxID=369723 RepID=A4X231_SALTO|nr:copper ion binding protein [Salinispora tropica]ABP52931.1 Heavy metal transport/detoxification protein [Salinispora tropica CNB-440]